MARDGLRAADLKGALVSTLLELVQRLQLEAAVSGDITTLVGATGETLRLKTWVQQGYQDLQNDRFNWDYLRSSQLMGSGVSFATVAGDAVYTLGTGSGTVGVTANGFGSWVRQAFRCQTTSVGVQDQMMLDWITYDEWRDGYAYGAMQSVQTRPVAIAVGPNNALCLGPYPAAGYTITGDYYLAPQTLSANADEPSNIPMQFQIAIVWRALWYYGMYEAAPEVVARAEVRYRQTSRQFGNLRGGLITAGRALA